MCIKIFNTVRHVQPLLACGDTNVHTCIEERMQTERLGPKTFYNLSSNTLLNHQLSQKLTLFGNGPNNVYQTFQQIQLSLFLANLHFLHICDCCEYFLFLGQDYIRVSPSVLPNLQRRLLRVETELGQKEEENAVLRQKLQQFDEKWSQYEAKMKSMEKTWQDQLTSMQVSFIAPNLTSVVPPIEILSIHRFKLQNFKTIKMIGMMLMRAWKCPHWDG